MQNETKVLIIDEDINRRNTLGHMLRGKGLIVDSAKGGFHGMQLLDHTDYNLLIIDEKLKDMGGKEVASLVRSRYDRIGLPIILIINCGEEESVQEALKMGINDIYFRSNDMNGLVKKALKHLS